MVSTRASTSFTPCHKPEASEAAVETCAICLDPLGSKPEAHTYCGHRFHAQCLVDSLQHDKRCPTCRNNVTQQRSEHADFDDMYDNGYAEQAASIVESRLALKVDADRMRGMLR